MELKISCKKCFKTTQHNAKSILYQYENPIHTLSKDLLVETVRLNVAEYDKRQRKFRNIKGFIQ